MKRLYFTPHTEAVSQFLFSYITSQMKKDTNYKILHLTPTLILFRKRRNDYTKQFIRYARRNKLEINPELIKNHVSLNEFHHWTKDYIYFDRKEIPLSRSESHVLIKRAITELLPNNREWLSVSQNLLELFLYLNSTVLKIDEMKEISPYRDWQTIIELYQHYNTILKDEGLEDFSQCLYRTLNEDVKLDEYSEVIFDGPFLFFDPIHELVMNKFSSMGKPVTFIVPFDRTELGVNPAYKVIEKVYSNYVAESQWERIDYQKGNSFFLEKVPNLLFTENSTNHDGSLTMNKYTTLEQELNDVLGQVKHYVTEGNVSQNKIAIVTPNSMEIRPIVREISENIGLNVEVPERSFLGLSVGEFIRLIYLIKTDDRKFEAESYLDSSMFKRILDSRWFKWGRQTLMSFQYVEEAFFSDITSLKEWEEQIGRLYRIKQSITNENLPYHPIHPVELEDLDCWMQVIKEIQTIQAKVFSIETGTIAEHANHLFETLEPLIEESEWNEEDSINEGGNSDDLFLRLSNILKGLNSQDRINLTPSEFGDIVLSLFEEKEEEQDEADILNEEPQSNKGIMVTSLQNIVYQNYKYIFTIEFTQEDYPNPEKKQWPLHTDILWRMLNRTTSLKVNSSLELEKLYSDREKYYFYLSFFSASNGYHISYSKSKQGSVLYPSHYLHDLAKTIDLEEDHESHGKNEKPKSIEDLLEEHGILKAVNYFKTDVKIENEGTNYEEESVVLPEKLSLDEIGVYQVCPKRFYYMQNFKLENVYSSGFQLTFYIATELFIKSAKKMILELENEKLVEVFESNKLRGSIVRSIPDLINKKDRLFDFFPVNNEVKEAAIFNARLFVENLIDQFFQREIIEGMKKKGMAHANVTLEANEIANQLEIQTEKGLYTVSTSREVASQIGFTPKRTFSFTHRPHLLGSSYYDAETDNQEKVMNWLNRLKREFFYIEKQEYVKTAILEVLTDMENSTFPKRKGAHCSYCPFIKVCLENQVLQESETEVEGFAGVDS